MADNFLEKHFAEYEARKSAWQNSNKGRRKTPLSLVSVSLLELPAKDFDQMKVFYSSVFGFVVKENNILSMPNGEFKLALKSQNDSNFLSFTLKIVSRYQYERLKKRLANLNIFLSDGDNSIKDPSGNIVTIEY